MQKKARQAGLDFYAVTDHCTHIGNSEFNEIKNAANQANNDGNFVAFWGYEWTNDSSGHILVVNSNEVESVRDNGSLNGFSTWLSGQRNAIAFFNHPFKYSSNDFNRFDFRNTNQIVGIELFNGRNTSFRRHYDTALDAGWNIGAAGGHDTHSNTWGSNPNRIAVLSKSLTRESILDAFRARRFYSTLNRRLYLYFSCDGEPMGSKIDAGTFDCYAETSGGNSSKIRLFQNGRIVDSWNESGSTSVTARGNGYLYVEVSNGNRWEAVSSPIFY